ncbi:MFS transporter [Natrinema sp. HArc-T2]|uniref:MFS transporter n=1 Tax=Natrinema sp. HArc-T2 TaxID=3242701 RepID=UPI00359D55A5
MSRQSTSRTDSYRRGLLALGFLSIASAVLVARANPATGYEVSLYAMTPRVVWIGLIAGMASALSVAVASMAATDRATRTTALGLGGLSMVAFVGLPIIRGYYFYGQNDSLTHLGWASAIRDGALSPLELFYPAMHTLSVIVHSSIGVSLRQSLLLVVVLAAVVFFVFVPLCVRTIVPSPSAIVVAAFSGFLLLPITTLSTHLHPHAMSVAILYAGLFVYVLLKYLVPNRDASRAALNRERRSITAIGTTLALVSMGAVIYHPQFVAHMIIVFAGICIVRFIVARVGGGSTAIVETRPLYGQTMLLIGMFFIWSANYGFFSDFVRDAIISAAMYLVGGHGSAGESISTQGASLAAIGGSIEGIFLKIFAAQVIFSLLAGGLILYTVFRRTSPELPSVTAVAILFAVGLIGLSVVFVMYLVSETSEMYFRVFGLMMVFVTVLGATAFHLGTNWFAQYVGSGTVTPVLAVGLSLLLVLSLIAVFPSPYIYNQSQHVTEQEMQGYETAFDTQADGIGFVGLRDAPNRYDDAIYGNENRSHHHGTVTESDLDGSLQYESDRYAVLTTTDYQRELLAYQGLRYSRTELSSLQTQRGIARVQSNGEFRQYLVTNEAPE